MKPLVAYVRVSTSGQGKSGLGIEAQRAAIARFAEAEGFEIVAEHVEIETGKGADALDRRPSSPSLWPRPSDVNALSSSRSSIVCRATSISSPD
jgi:hypothetical protein